jgi:L-aspartate oxidase
VPSILIIGGGLAGLFTALKLSPLPCTVLTPAPLGEGASSTWAQGGIAAAIGEGDTVEAHVADTLRAGAGLCDPAVVQLMASEASARIHDLLELGVPFDRDLDGKLVQSREAAHSANRVVRVRGDMAGAKIMEALIAAVRRTPSIRVLEGTQATEIVLDENRAVTGIEAYAQGRIIFIPAQQVVLATGGLGQMYRVTTNPIEAWGSGLAMAHRAGATLVNMEFVQFHPTGLDIGRDPAPLATEALRGEGATLVDRSGHRFMFDLHTDAELAPRDVVARGVQASIAAGRGAFLDCRSAIGAHFAELFPTVYATCQSVGIDPARDLLPVAPAAHYHMGGVLTDENGRVRGEKAPQGLFAIGEVACTGVHGANRLASNSLLEAVVFGSRVAETLGWRNGATHARIVDIRLRSRAFAEGYETREIALIREAMQQHVGVLRNREGLLKARHDVFIPLKDSGATTKVRAMGDLGDLMASAALKREESRGGHARTDFPEPWNYPLWSGSRLGSNPWLMPLA